MKPAQHAYPFRRRFSALTARLSRSWWVAGLLGLSALGGAPALAATLSVTSAGDVFPVPAGLTPCSSTPASCTLRAAVAEINNFTGPHTITFAVPTVTLANGGGLAIQAPVTITGAPVTRTVINGNGKACFSLTDAASVLNPNGANGSTIANLVIQNCNSDGISANGHGYTFINNFIGTNQLGVSAAANTGHGISVSSSRVYPILDFNSIPNISGALSTLNSGLPALPLGTQADISNFSSQLATALTTLTAPVKIINNVISGNANNGIEIFSQNLAATLVSGNMIGTDLTGNIAIANGKSGIRMVGSTFANLIGPGNTISGNTEHGISVASGSVYLPNFIMGNRIGLPTVAGSHIGNGMSGISTDTKPDTAPTSFNASMISLIIGPGNVIGDNKGTTSTPSDLETVNAEVDAGIVITGASNAVKVIGNTIGLAEFPTGAPSTSTSYGNAGSGILVTIAGNTIGGSTAASGNIIGGNARHGILAKGSSNTGTQILGNSIGVHPAFAGNLTLGNVGDGVHIDDTNATVIGGPGATDFNTIAANGRHGIALRGGNANDGWGNLFQRNVIFHNAGLGIDLDHPRNAVDDSQHSPTPANYGNLDQNQPVICVNAANNCTGFAAPSFSAGNVHFDWTLVTNASSTYRLEFFKVDSSALSTATSMSFIGEQTVTTNAGNVLNGCINGRCSTTLAASVLGSNVLMTATDITPIIIGAGNPSWLAILKCVALNTCVNNNTSEFSNVVPITANSNASLSALAVSSGALVPAFASGTFVYADAVANAVNTITVTPTVADPTATVKVNGNTVANGSASGAVALAVGANAITIVVTAQDGTTTQTYTVNVTRAAPALNTNASLSALTVSAGSLVPVFASGTLVYADAVANAIATITVTPTLADATASVKVNGNAVTSGSASGAIALAVGANAITVLVTAQDGTTTQTYSVNVTRAAALSNNASLSALTVSSGSLIPVFASGTLVYANAVANAVASMTVTPTVADATATVKVNGTTVASGSASGAIALLVGANPITVVVTAQDGITIQTYTVNVNRAGALSNNANLSALTVSSGSLVPVFASATLAYTDAVANAVTSITVTPTVAQANATVKVNGVTVASGSASGAIALAVGANPITVLVTAQDGTTTQSYTVNVPRAAALSSNANLSSLAVSSGSLVPVFASATLVYTNAVANAVSTMTVTPTVADATATIKVNGTTVASGSASGALALAVGANAITVIVTAQDGTTTQTYTVNVTRAAAALSSNASLSALTVSSGSLAPVFASATLTYANAVANAPTSITVTPTVAQANATIKVNGNTVASGSASAAIALAVGANPITVVVTAQDGTTTQTYTVNVTRAAAALSSNANLSALVVSGGSLAPAFASATLTYANAVANAATSTTVTPTVADPNATVKVNGVGVASGSASAAIALAVGANTVTIAVTAQDGTTTLTYTVNVTRAAPIVTVFSGATFTGTGTATATLSGGGATCTFGTTAFVGPSAPAPAGVSFPDGLVDFTTTNCTGTITVTLTFPTAFASGAQYWKYGPTPTLSSPHWYTLAAGLPNNLVLSGKTATFTITDGGLGDDDLTVNGTIVDAGGIGIAAAVVAVDPVTVPTLSLWSLLLLSGLMLLGFVGVRRAARIRR